MGVITDYRLLSKEEVKQLKAGDKIKIGDVETKVIKFQKGSSGIIGFFTNGRFLDGNSDYYSFAMDADIPIYKLEEKEITKQFTKADLKTGMMVTYRGEETQCIVMLGHSAWGRTTDVLACVDGFNYLNEVEDNLKYEGDSHWDIIKVEEPLTFGLDLSDKNYKVI
jgi:translation elongation factor P/translation initiation factor 5A